jgi:integrase/recombinase XerD
MTTIHLKYVTTDLDRHGNTRHYFRRPGQKKIRLRGVPGSVEFREAYERALTGGHTPKETDTKSFAHLCEEYYRSAKFKELDPATRAWQTRALDRVCATGGHARYDLVRKEHVVKLIDTRAESSPSEANKLLKSLRSLFKWHGRRDPKFVDPTIGVEMVKYNSEGHHSWTDEEIARFELTHPIGSKPRLAMALLLYTTGRREDVVRLGRKHMSGGRLKFVQAKNEHRKPVEIDIPVHHELAAIIRATPVVGVETFLVNEHGRAYTPNTFSIRFREWCDKAGLPQCTPHGLRKAMATRLADAGATVHEIMAITGHQTLSEVERYTRAASKKRLADAGMSKVEGQQ